MAKETIEKLQVKFVKEKETKNTIRFTEDQEGRGYDLIGTIYVPKMTLGQNGIDAEKGFIMTIEPVK